MGYGRYDDANFDNREAISRRRRDRQDYAWGQVEDQSEYEEAYRDSDGRQLYYRSRPATGQQSRNVDEAQREAGRRERSERREGSERSERRGQYRQEGTNVADQDYRRGRGEQDQDADWARQVRQQWQRGPYGDYGWERGESTLPEFRDPSVHRTPYEEEEIEEQQRRRQREQRPDFRRAYDAERVGRMPTGEMPDQRGYSAGYAREEWWNVQGPHTGKGPRGYQRSNERIREDVSERLWQHGQIDASEMEVRVDNGEVTLAGTVDSRRTKRLAEDIAESVAGVRDVHNELRVRQEERQGQHQTGPQQMGQQSSQSQQGQHQGQYQPGQQQR